MAQEKIPLDAQRFATGMTWKDYLAQMGDTRARTEENYNKASLTAEEKQFFSCLEPGQVTSSCSPRTGAATSTATRR